MSDSDHSSQSNATPPADDNPAAALVRAKLAALYSDEPNASEELQEAETATPPRSKHQQYMHELNQSGKSLAEIQTAWHEYYTSLPDNEKHEVWQEFYAAHEQASQFMQQQLHTSQTSATSKQPAEKPIVDDKPQVIEQQQTVEPRDEPRSEAEIKQQILKKVRHRSQRSKRKLSRKDHLKSLTFGLSMGLVVVFIVMFTFFNERFITPFITPSTKVSATPIIVDPTQSNNVGPEAKVIIPKINVEIPVLYNVPTIDDATIQRGLSEAVVHYPTTPNPGELGNGVIFGHSSGNIFDKSKAKFAFLQLHELSEGDLFYLNKDGKQYAYKIISKRVVPPTDVSVLTDTMGHPATFTLITCDPPGLNVNRMVITGEQISPAPSSNQKSTATPDTQKPIILPGNSESLWHKLTTWLTH